MIKEIHAIFAAKALLFLSSPVNYAAKPKWVLSSWGEVHVRRRVTPVLPSVSNAPLHNALTLMIQQPPSHLGLQDSKHQLLAKIHPSPQHTHTPNCNMGQACRRSRWLVHIIGSAGHFPCMIIACNTHPRPEGLSMCTHLLRKTAANRGEKTPGPRLTSETVLSGCPHNNHLQLRLC